MILTARFRLIAWLALFAIACAGVWRLWQSPAPTVQTTVIAPEVPVVMRTPGGLLEVAVIRAQERFTRSDPRSFWGIPLGTTVSHVQMPAYYRYHIPLAREWPMTIRGKTCIVRAPAIEPSLPVAFDTANLQKYTQSGWARFDKAENLAALEASITPELAKRAGSASYRQLVADPARQTVREFVSKWLVSEKGWGGSPDYRIVVLFPGESEPAADAPRPD